VWNEASFFKLGGNSLRAVALSRRLMEALGWPVGVADVLQMLAARGGGDAEAVVVSVLVRCGCYSLTPPARRVRVGRPLSMLGSVFWLANAPRGATTLHFEIYFPEGPPSEHPPPRPARHPPPTPRGSNTRATKG